MNLEQVAIKAGVSTATVSRVLNNTASVRNNTRARVMKAVEELKYSPNLHARSLAGGKSRSIGIIVPNMENPSFLDIYKVVATEAQSAGFEVVMASTDYRPERLLTNVRLMIGWRIRGLAAIGSRMDSNLIKELNCNRIPMVFYDAGAPGPNFTNVRLNYQSGIEKMVTYLYSLGHRRIGLVGHDATFGPLNERMKVVLEALARCTDLETKAATGLDSLEGGRRATRALVTAYSNLTAIICVNDIMAVGALRELRECGIEVPRDVSVTGFDNITLAQFCQPPLTSMHIPRGKIGQTIWDCLMKTENPLFQQEFVIDVELVVRDSTGPAPTRKARG